MATQNLQTDNLIINYFIVLIIHVFLSLGSLSDPLISSIPGFVTRSRQLNVWHGRAHHGELRDARNGCELVTLNYAGEEW
jgi:hypothetical protein